MVNKDGLPPPPGDDNDNNEIIRSYPGPEVLFEDINGKQVRRRKDAQEAISPKPVSGWLPDCRQSDL
jgi:hypothetical protein